MKKDKQLKISDIIYKKPIKTHYTDGDICPRCGAKCVPNYVGSMRCPKCNWGN